MRKTYKNKRDFYKAEAAQAKAEAVRKQMIIDSLSKQLEDKKEEANKRYDARVYCTNCKKVAYVSIPPGVKIEDGDCTNCRVRKCLLLVIE